LTFALVFMWALSGIYFAFPIRFRRSSTTSIRSTRHVNPAPATSCWSARPPALRQVCRLVGQGSLRCSTGAAAAFVTGALMVEPRDPPRPQAIRLNKGGRRKYPYAETAEIAEKKTPRILRVCVLCGLNGAQNPPQFSLPR
jgi:hypothetical protein